MNWTDSLPAGYVGLQAEPDDLGEVNRLIQAVEIDVQGSSTSTEDALRTTFGEPGFDPAMDIISVRDDSGTLAGLAVFTSREPYVSSWTTGWVHPDHVGRGIGGALIDWAEARARSRIDLAPPGTRVAASMGANDKSERGKRLLASRGYTVARYFLEMEIELDHRIDVPHVPDGITLRTMRPDEDVIELSVAVADAFRDHFGYTDSPPEKRVERWRQWRTSEMWDDDLVWLAEDETGLVGINVCLRENGAKSDQGYVASLGVLPRRRGIGLARCLLLTSFAEYQQRDKASVSLHVDADSITGATRLYTGVGMHEVETEIDFELEIRAGKDIVVR